MTRMLSTQATPPQPMNGGKPTPSSGQTTGFLTANDALALDQRPAPPLPPTFDQDVILEPSPRVPRLLLWGLVSVLGSALAWAAWAKMEIAVLATGKLEPQGSVATVDSPINGQVISLLVKEGQTVKAGDLLMRLDPAIDKSQMLTRQQQRQQLQEENQIFQAILNKQPLPSQVPASIQALLLASEAELQSRLSAAQLQIQQLQIQLTQNQEQLLSAQSIFQSNQTIIGNIQPLVESGAVARLQVLREEQRLETSQAEVQRLEREIERLTVAITQAQQQKQNLQASSDRDFLTRITENQKRLTELAGQLRETELVIGYKELRAPISGVIFDLYSKNSGFVVAASQPLLKIVPEDNLLAKVYITNRDIGFVRQGMPAEIRVDAFPFREFGGIKGSVTRIGSDSLPPEPNRQYYSFPTEIRLDNQFLSSQDTRIKLHSGMSVSVNIKVHQRTVLSIVTDMMTKQVESLQFIR